MWKTSLYDTTKLTVELREIIDAGVNVWDFEYPSYYEGEAKRAFEQKVIDHYLFHQIGQETVGRWLHQFRTRVREIMPYYIQLYESCDLMAAQEDPFQAYDLTETYTEKTEGSGTTSGSHNDKTNTESSGTNASTQTRNATNKKLDTAQGSVQNLTDGYLTEAGVEDATETHNETASSQANASNSGTSSTEHADSGSKTYTLTRKGNIGVQPLGKEVEALRDAFLNVDMLIINELRDLFLMVY